jgi:hypothetical protein
VGQQYPQEAAWEIFFHKFTQNLACEQKSGGFLLLLVRIIFNVN